MERIKKDTMSTLDKQQEVATEESDKKDVFSDIKYICNSTSLIVDSLQKGLDIAQLPNGDIIVTEVRTINTQYSWNKDKNKMVKISQS